MIIKLIMCIILFIIIPEFLGMLISKFFKKEENIFFNLILGFIMQFAILEIIAIPMIFFKSYFLLMAKIWFIIVSSLSLLSLILNLKKFNKIMKNIFNQLKVLPLITIVVLILVGFQTFMLARYAHIDDDDAFYVATATVTIQKGTMYRSCAEDGGYYGGFPTRYVLSPFPLYTAVISHFTNIHPAIIAHTVFPIIFIPLAYILYGIIADKLFNKDKTSVMLFLIILSVVYMFGNYSIRSNFSFLLFRIWQGKALLANILLPFSWIVYLDCIENNKWVNWFILFIICLASCLVSSMGIALMPINIGILGLIFTIKNKKITYLIKSIISVIPCISLGIIYLFLI